MFKLKLKVLKLKELNAFSASPAAWCLYNGDLESPLADKERFVAALPPRAFWLAAVGASVLNSVVKTLETKAFAESDISLCAPFLAFDPVMQFVVGVCLMPVACSFMVTPSLLLPLPVSLLYTHSQLHAGLRVRRGQDLVPAIPRPLCHVHRVRRLPARRRPGRR